VKNEHDVEVARRRGVAMALLTPEWVSASGYRESFRPLLFVWDQLAGQVDAPYSRVLVRNPEVLRSRSMESLVTLLLKVNGVAARMVLARNPGKFDPNEVYRYVRNENLEEKATRVGFQDFVGTLPVVGEKPSRTDLRWMERNAPPALHP
jgi:hypothetical protein